MIEFIVVEQTLGLSVWRMFSQQFIFRFNFLNFELQDVTMLFIFSKFHIHLRNVMLPGRKKNQIGWLHMFCQGLQDVFQRSLSNDTLLNKKKNIDLLSWDIWKHQVFIFKTGSQFVFFRPIFSGNLLVAFPPASICFMLAEVTLKLGKDFLFYQIYIFSKVHTGISLSHMKG